MLPRIQPMRLTRIAQPFDDSDYLFELKHDGFRATVYKQPLSQAWPLSRVWN
jgi:ATP-dependent DNA ligase